VIDIFTLALLWAALGCNNVGHGNHLMAAMDFVLCGVSVIRLLFAMVSHD
jgi:hypothetical protein